MALDATARKVLNRLVHEAAIWRQEPMKRVAVRNKVIHPLRVRQFAAFGADSIIDRPMWLYGPQHMSVGSQVIILRGGWLAVEKTAWGNAEPALRIGDGVAIRPGCTLSAAESIVLEDHVGMGAYVTIIDSAHTWKGGNANALYNPIESAPIHVGKGTWIADRATVAAGAVIGEQCAIGPGATVSNKEIPDYSIVLGNPGRVVGSTQS